MAHLRLIAIALVIAACGRAGAQGSGGTIASGITPPAGWTALPDVARATGAAAKAEGVTVASEAWGEPARGCYAVWLRLDGSGASADQVLDGIASEKLEIKDLVKPTAEDGQGILSLAFARPGYTGRLRARIASGSITALACFANERETVACTTTCTALLGSLP